MKMTYAKMKNSAVMTLRVLLPMEVAKPSSADGVMIDDSADEACWSSPNVASQAMTSSVVL